MRAKILAAGLIALVPSLTQADGMAPPILAMGLCASGVADAVGATAPPAPLAKVELKTGYGAAHWTIATQVPDAQAFFDDGLNLAHAFAHKEATAAFAEAVRRDPDCAMCLWGQAWSAGPTINFTIEPKDQAQQAALVARAETLAANGPPLERQLIAALKLRYQNGGGKGAGDLAFAQALDDIARAHPDDDVLTVLAADAWMIPASLRNTKDHLPRAVELLETVLKRSPDDASAIHFYIHATEMSGFGGRAEAAADRLGRVAPAASHLQHMPSHTYYWVGRYADAYTSNAAADRLDAANAKEKGLSNPISPAYGLFYHSHNVHYGASGALMAGDGAGAMDITRDFVASAQKIPPNAAWTQMVAVQAYAARGRFDDPTAVLALPDPGDQRPFVQALWRYARGEALARQGDAAGVRREAELVRRSAGELKGFGHYAGQVAPITDVAALVLEGRAAMLEGRPGKAADAFRKAAKLDEKRLADQTDPPFWWYSTRRSLAAALLAAGDAQGAVDEARTALVRRPADPVALDVLAQAERAQGLTAQADAHLAQARKGWAGDLSKLPLNLI